MRIRPFLHPRFYQWFFLYLAMSVVACHSQKENGGEALPELPEEISLKAAPAEDFSAKKFILRTKKINDTLLLKNDSLVKEMYKANGFTLFWSENGSFRSETDSLLALIRQAGEFGLFPADYYGRQAEELKDELLKSALSKPDDKKWIGFDMLATSAFVQLVKDLKVGRLLPDAVVKRDSTLSAHFFLDQKERFSQLPIDSFAYLLEPSIPDYHELKKALHFFLPKARMKKYTIIRPTDSLLFPKLVYQRIAEEDSLKIKKVKDPDSLTISKTIRKYQKWKKLQGDGKITAGLLKRLNNTDREKFLRIAISLDRYKLLPTLPDTYLWVNLPSYFMELRTGDSTTLKSKIICGKQATKTPEITSLITDMMTYPQWTIPASIIKNEILPGLKANAGYTKRKGYSIIDAKGEEVNPWSVNWSKYKNSIPYRVVQGSGDANALGVIKFNFANAYAVYLHDTNQRYLFGKTSRALSHGCVRVQKWKELADYLLRRDLEADSTSAVPLDSLNAWLTTKKKKYIKVQQPLPLFIRYITCEGRKGKLVWHEDIYEEDRRLREKLFAAK